MAPACTARLYLRAACTIFGPPSTNVRPASIAMQACQWSGVEMQAAVRDDLPELIAALRLDD
jgi:hypothetical protein